MVVLTPVCRRVAKKKFKEDPQAGEEFAAAAMANLTFATRSPPSLPPPPDLLTP